MDLFIADTHLGHAHILGQCRPQFATVEEMDAAIIDGINRKMSERDTLYILGDFTLAPYPRAVEYLKAIKPRKVLIVGNHDHVWLRDMPAWERHRYFDGIYERLSLRVGRNELHLDHYPRLSWNRSHYEGSLAICGHIHNKREGSTAARLFSEVKYQYNAGVDVNGFEPVTLSELVRNNMDFYGLTYTDEEKARLDQTIRELSGGGSFRPKKPARGILSVPIINRLSTAETRPDYFRWLERIGAERVFLATEGTNADPETNHPAAVARFAENVAAYRAHGYEVGIWMNGLGHGGDLSPEVYARTAHMTRIRDLETGAEISDSFCPLDPAHRRNYTENLLRLAGTHPDLIMLDDDLRLSGHGPVSVGCACPRHMALFNERARAAGVSDRDMTREELSAILLSGKPTPHRRVWLDLMGDTLRDLATDLRRALDTVDPSIRLGHCACLSTWDLDGVDSVELARLFAGKTRPFLRLIGAPYWTGLGVFRTTGLGSVIDLVRLQTAWCRARATEMELMSEGDVYPRPRFNVPASYLESYHQVLTADGLPGILKYMFDYGHEPDYETGYLRLHELKSSLRRDLAEAFADTEAAGIYVFEAMHKWETADCTGLGGYDYFDRFTPASVNFVSRLGLPAAYERTRFTPTTLVFGENAAHVPLDALQENLILDAPAARQLLARGVDIGLAAVEPMPTPAEETIGDPNRSFPRVYPTDPGAAYFRLTPAGEPRVLGAFEDGSPAVIACTTQKGKTVVVYAFDMETVSFDSTYMKNDPRRRQLLDLAELEIPVDIPEPRLYVLCRRSRNRTVVGIWNFSADIGLPQAGIRVSGQTKGSRLSPIGDTTVTPEIHADGRVTVRCDSEIPPYCFAGFVCRSGC